MPTADDQRRERGAQAFSEVMNFAAPPQSGDADPVVEQGVLRTVFAELWTRPGLTRKERRLITLTAVAASANQTAIDTHLKAALDTGDLTVDEVKELTLHFAYYAGFPRSTGLTMALKAYQESAE